MESVGLGTTRILADYAQQSPRTPNSTVLGTHLFFSNKESTVESRSLWEWKQWAGRSDCYTKKDM